MARPSRASGPPGSGSWPIDVGQREHHRDRDRGHHREAGDPDRDQTKAGGAGRKPELDEPALLIAAPSAGARQKCPEGVDKHGRAEPAPGQVSRHRVQLGRGGKQKCELPRDKLHLLREARPRGGTVADLREQDRVEEPAGRSDQRGHKKTDAVRSKREPEESHPYL
jgi:hypothetical protein